MNKILVFGLLLLFISSSFTVSVNSVLASSELVEDSWNTKTAITHERRWFEVTVLDDKIYAISGNINGNYVDFNERYDPKTDTWTILKPIPTPRINFGIVVYQGKIYCIGGEGGSFEDGGVMGVNEVYDVETDRWETKTPMPTARGNLCANLVNGKIYLIGGGKQLNWMDLTPIPNVNEVYDIASDTWSSRTPPPVTVSSYISAVVDDKIYVMSQVSQNSMVTLIYDTETDLWSYGTPCPSSMFGAGIGATTGEWAPVRIYVVGGNPTFDRVGVYDPKVDTWTWGALMPTGRYALSVAVKDDVLYVFGGAGADANNEMYIPFGYKIADLQSSSPVNSPLLPNNDSWSMGDILVAVAVVGIITAGVAVGCILVLRAKKRRD